jgi:hypothetical protein
MTCGIFGKFGQIANWSAKTSLGHWIHITRWQLPITTSGRLGKEFTIKRFFTTAERPQIYVSTVSWAGAVNNRAGRVRYNSTIC